MVTPPSDSKPDGRPRGCKRRPEYAIWAMLKYRCLNRRSPDYKSYGGAGVRFHEGWRGPDGFKTFLADVGPQPFPGAGLRRRDPQGHFEPGNVEWGNPRTGRAVTHDGHTRSAADWARELGLKAGTVRSRLRKGWSPPRALCGRLRPSRWLG